MISLDFFTTYQKRGRRAHQLSIELRQAGLAAVVEDEDGIDHLAQANPVPAR